LLYCVAAMVLILKIPHKITTNYSNLQDLGVKNQKCWHNLGFYG